MYIFIIALNIFFTFINVKKYNERKPWIATSSCLLNGGAVGFSAIFYILTTRRTWISKKKREEYIQNRFKNLAIIYNDIFIHFLFSNTYNDIVAMFKELPENKTSYNTFFAGKMVKVYLECLHV